MVKLGLICFSNNSGLGNQTRRLTEFLKPFRLLVIDSSGFSKNKERNFHWYDNFSGYRVNGFPTDHEINVFLKGLTHVFCCENPLNFHLFARASQLGIKTYVQSNYEFCDNLNQPYLPLPSKFIMPSYWKVEEMKELFGDSRVQYLPPPINPNEFKVARDLNLLHAGPRRFLHVIGTLAVNDRNGTLDLLEALKFTDADFSLTITSQHELPSEYMINDRRVTYKIENVTDVQELYKNYDGLILPRRYGGLSLAMQEALMSGLPVIMPDISPNYQILPKEWLLPAKKKGEFMTRTMIDIYEVDPKDIAEKIDYLVNRDCEDIKLEAFELGYNNFSETVLASKYNALW